MWSCGTLLISVMGNLLIQPVEDFIFRKGCGVKCCYSSQLIFFHLGVVLLLVICDGAFRYFVRKECNTIKQDGILFLLLIICCFRVAV